MISGTVLETDDRFFVKQRGRVVAHKTIWISRIQLKRRDFVLVDDGIFGIDEETPIASRMYLGYHEHCSDDHMIEIRRHRVDVNTYLILSCGSPRCRWNMRIDFPNFALMEAFTFRDLVEYCQMRMKSKAERKARIERLLALDLDRLELLLAQGIT